MFKEILCFSLMVAVCSAQLPLGPQGFGGGQALPLPRGGAYPHEEGPKPYNFGYNVADEFGTHWSRQEQQDGNGVVVGSYGFKDATGLFRTVEYIADDINGFRANVQSNEPGLISSAPADVVYTVGGTNRK